jgi:hypothetical protein
MHAEGDIDLMRNDEHLRIIVRKFKDLGVGISSIGALELEQKFVETVVKDVTLFWRDFEVSVNQNKTLGPVFLP